MRQDRIGSSLQKTFFESDLGAEIDNFDKYLESAEETVWKCNKSDSETIPSIHSSTYVDSDSEDSDDDYIFNTKQTTSEYNYQDMTDEEQEELLHERHQRFKYNISSLSIRALFTRGTVKMAN